MPTKKFLATLFNKDYFLLQLKRHRWLAFVPLGIFTGLAILCLALDIPLGALMVLVVPYALCIVPITALIIFRSYAQKNEASHLHSMPIARIAIFISSYFAGLVLLLVPIILMLLAICMDNTFEFRIILSAIALAVFYFTIASLGCVLGGNLPTQLAMMGAIAFGPVLIYLLVKFGVTRLAFGGGNWSATDHKILIWLLPIMSAIAFGTDSYGLGSYMLDNGNENFFNAWPYWWVHLLIVIGLFVLCLYLVKRRATELSGQASVFKRTNEYFLQPVIFLTIVYTLFSICSLVLYDGSYFNTELYLKVFALLLGTSLIVSILMQIWLENHYHRSFIQYLSKSCAMSMLACAIFLIPLYLNENRNIIVNQEYATILLETKYYHSTVYFERLKVDENQEVFEELENMVRENKDKCLLTPRWNGEPCLSLTISNDDYSVSNTYYFYAKDFNQAFLKLDHFIELIKQQRENAVSNFKPEYYTLDDEGNVYHSSEMVQAMCDSFEATPPDDYLTSVAEALGTGDYLMGTVYIYSFSSLSFNEWYDSVISDTNKVLKADEWNQAVQYAGYLVEPNRKEVKQIERTTKEAPFDQLIIEDYDSYAISIISVEGKKIRMQVPYYVRATEDVEIFDQLFFEDTQFSITANILVDLENGTVTLEEIKGVGY